jgi:hypothetical protein
VLTSHEAQGHEAQGSSLERSKEGRTLRCPRADKDVAGSSFRSGVGWGGVGGGGHECPLADRAVVGSNVQKRGGDTNVQEQVGLSLQAMFK